MPRLSYALKAFIAISALLFSSMAVAKDYVVDLVIFESTAPIGEAHYSDKLYYPVTRNALSLGSNQAQQAGFKAHKPSSESNAIVAKLTRSAKYNVIQQLSWVQPGLTTAQARPLRLAYKDAITLYIPTDAKAEQGLITAVKPGTAIDVNQVTTVDSHRFSGTITVSLGKYLHLDTNLVLISDDGSMSTKMQLHRRMRSLETHYLDNPRFGLVVHFTPIEP